MHPAKGPEHEAGEYPNVQAGNDQHVISPRTLEIYSHRPFDKGPFSDQHRIDKGRVVL